MMNCSMQNWVRCIVAGFSLSNYIRAAIACDWTGKREAELRVAETESMSGERRSQDGGGQEEGPVPLNLQEEISEIYSVALNSHR